MELHQVAYAVAVADHDGFTRAALASHVSQPALSQAVRTLESELGAALFHRLGRRVVLTAAGEAFLGPARQLLRDMENVRATVAAVAGLSGGRLDLAALPTLAVDPLTPLIGSFRAEHPRVMVRLVEPEDADAVVAMVHDGRAELGLTAFPLPDEIEVCASSTQEILAVCPPATRLSGTGTLPIAWLESVPLVTTPSGTSTRRLLEEALAGASIVPTVAVETAHREAIVPLVLAGAGTSFLPEAIAQGALDRGAVIAPLDPPLRRRVALVRRPGPVAPAAEAFVELAQARLPQDGAGDQAPVR